jgi:hypothetical protein
MAHRPGNTPDPGEVTFTTELLGNGVPLQDVQDAMGHADPRTTRRYDRSRHNLDRHPTYQMATNSTAQAVHHRSEVPALFRTGPAGTTR